MGVQRPGCRQVDLEHNGLGASSYEHEWRAHGFGFADIPIRQGLFREACQIVYHIS
jgi:hypothetical protein